MGQSWDTNSVGLLCPIPGSVSEPVPCLNPSADYSLEGWDSCCCNGVPALSLGMTEPIPAPRLQAPLEQAWLGES